jgi:transposase-like protein
MAKGTRLPEETKIDIAERFHRGEDINDLAQRFGISPFTVREYGGKYDKGNKRARVRRKVTVQPVQKKAKENTRVSGNQAEMEALKREAEFWKDAFLTEFQKNRNA